MTDMQASLARLDKDKLDYLFSSVLGLVGEKTNVLILSPETQHDGKLVIVARGYALRVTEEMVSQLVSYCEAEKVDPKWLDFVASIAKNPNDRSLQLKPYVGIDEDNLPAQEANTLTGEDYENIDTQFMAIYASLKGYYQELNNLCQQASQYHVTIGHNLAQDVALRFGVAEGDKVDLEIFCQDALDIRKTQTRYCLGNEEEFARYFPKDAAGGKTKAIPFGEQIVACVSRMNSLLTDFITQQDDPHKAQYAEIIVHDFVHTLARVGSMSPYYRCGDGIDNIEDHPDIMAAIDTLTIKVLQHVSDIPLTAMGENVPTDHYAFDYENFLIYARDKNHQVIGELTDPDYAIAPLLDNVSESAFVLLSVRLAELRNKHVFKKIGQLVMAENPEVLH